MKILIQHTLRRTSMERFVETYFSDRFNDAIGPDIGVRERQRVEYQQLEDGRVHSKTKVVPKASLPRAVRKLIGDIPIEYHEVSTYDPRNHSLDFCIDHVATKYMRVWGEIRFTAVEDGVHRVLDLNLECDVRVVRRLVEKVIESELRKAYDRKAELMQRWLDQHAERSA